MQNTAVVDNGGYYSRWRAVLIALNGRWGATVQMVGSGADELMNCHFVVRVLCIAGISRVLGDSRSLSIMCMSRYPYWYPSHSGLGPCDCTFLFPVAAAAVWQIWQIHRRWSWPPPFMVAYAAPPTHVWVSRWLSVSMCNTKPVRPLCDPQRRTMFQPGWARPQR